MPNYVDNAELESDWFHWVIAKSVPALEPYRQTGCLWTKVGTVAGKRGLKYPNPYDPLRQHYLAVGGDMLKFYSRQGVVLAPAIRNHQLLTYKMPLEWSIEAEFKYRADIPNQPIEGFVTERPTRKSWDALASKIWLICSGISDYHLPASDELYNMREDMINETAAQVLSKLKHGKLKYHPGQAPVFNLLSTTIHNLCYSFMAKESRIAANKQKLIHEAWNGMSPLAAARELANA